MNKVLGLGLGPELELGVGSGLVNGAGRKGRNGGRVMIDEWCW